MASGRVGELESQKILLQCSGVDWRCAIRRSAGVIGEPGEPVAFCAESAADDWTAVAQKLIGSIAIKL